MPTLTELSWLYSTLFSPEVPKLSAYSPLWINPLSVGEFVLSTIEDAPVSTRKRSESEPLTNAVTYMRLSPAMANGISPIGASFIILAFAMDVTKAMDIKVIKYACNLIKILISDNFE